MWSAYLIVAVLVVILIALARALLAMLRGGAGRADRASTARALTWRIGLSVALFVLLLVGYATGVLEPHGVQRGFGPPAPAGTPAQSQ